MDAKLILAPEAEYDIAEAYAWFERRRTGLGEEFLSCVEACSEAIRRNPHMNSLLHERYRRALMRRVPYVLFYEHEEGTVNVYGVFHTSSDPRKWRQRQR